MSAAHNIPARDQATPPPAARLAGVLPDAAAYWPVPLVRAVPALAVGLTITFLQDHSARVGALSFGLFALAAGVWIAASGARMLGPNPWVARGTVATPAATTDSGAVGDPVTRGILVTQGVVSAIAGGLGLAIGNGASVTGSGISELLLLVTLWAAVTGLLELYLGLRHRGTLIGRDWLALGGITAVAALAFLFLPPDPVFATGLFGAYAVIVGVYLVIAALSLRWAQHPTPKDNPTP